MLDAVVNVLACPHCGEGLSPGDGSLRCAAGHAFDIARQGYVSLLSAKGRPNEGDTADMVAARAGFLAAGHYEPIAAEISSALAGTRGCVADIGAGTGYYLARVLEELPEATGVALDTSKYACRRAAKAHPRIGAVVADAWQRMPLRTGSAAALLNVFAPRNAAEMHRVLRPGGRLVVVTPNQQHLASLVDALGLLHVDERKRQRLDGQLAGRFEPLAERTVEFPLSLTADDAAALVAMGPSAWHTSAADLRDRIAALPSPLQVTASVSVGLYQRC